MLTVTSINKDVEKLIRNIIAKNNLKGKSNITYQVGSEAGNGYTCRTVAVDIINSKRTFRIFLKCPLNVESTAAMPMDRLYSNEVYFYKEIRPAYLEFCKNRGVENALQNIPICYGTSGKIVALENLKERHFTMCDRTRCLDNDHIELVLQGFAHFHAISFAFKDQRTQKYQKLLENIYDIFSPNCEKTAFMAKIKNTVNRYISKLDAVKDKDILDVCNRAVEKLILIISSPSRTLNKYSILTQCDCHCNNMMFQYQREYKEKPCDIMLVDWQCPREASPVFDLSYFLYSVASKEALDNFNNYLKVYHNELCKNIRMLGSNPEILYPFEVLEKEWKQHCKYGLIMAFSIIRVMLSSGDEIFDMEKFNFENAENTTEPFIPNLKKEDEYENRMRILIEHMIKNNFLE